MSNYVESVKLQGSESSFGEHFFHQFVFIIYPALNRVLINLSATLDLEIVNGANGRETRLTGNWLTRHSFLIFLPFFPSSFLFYSSFFFFRLFARFLLVLFLMGDLSTRTNAERKRNVEL